MVWIKFLIVSAVAVLCAANTIDQRNKIILYHSMNNETYPLASATDILTSSLFDSTKKTLLYIHGWTESQNSKSVRGIVDAYLIRGDHNILVMDWAKDASSLSYLLVLPKLKNLALLVAEKLRDMINAGLDLEKLHLVGHSMGGQMIGRIGKKMKTDYSMTLKRISAIDPASAGFYGIGTVHITKNDADFVDIIHTDAGGYGGPISSGHVDFWPNGGARKQPGCPTGLTVPLTEDDFCSHGRSWRFWAESVVRTGVQNEFIAVKANSWKRFKQGNVQTGQVAVMGIDCPTNIEGDYYLTTNTEAPFARGIAGITYSAS